MKLSEAITTIRQHIAQDELPQALVQLKTLLENSPQLDEVLLQSGRFSELRKRIRTGVIREADADVTKNRLREGLLDLLRELEERDSTNAESSQSAKDGRTTIHQQADKIYNIDHIDNANFS